MLALFAPGLTETGLAGFQVPIFVLASFPFCLLKTRLLEQALAFLPLSFSQMFPEPGALSLLG